MYTNTQILSKSFLEACRHNFLEIYFGIYDGVPKKGQFAVLFLLRCSAVRSQLRGLLHSHHLPLYFQSGTGAL